MLGRVQEARRRRLPDAGDALLRDDAGVRRHLRRATLLAPLIALLTVAQGFALAALIVALAQQTRFAGTAAAVLITATVVRGALTWWLERTGRLAAADAIGRLRDGLVRDAATLAASAPGTLRAGEVAADAVHQLPAIEAYVGRFLAQKPISAATTVIVLIAIAWTDWLSALLLAPTVPLLIVFLWLVGSEAGAQAERRLASLQLLGAHLLDVLRGLADLRAFGRADHQRSQVRLAADAYRVQTMETLRSAFISGLVLELVAMLGTALIAVFGGVRLAEGGGSLAAILPALVLAPQLYAPLRRLGGGYHEAADARAALGRLAQIAALAGSTPLAGDAGGRPSPRPDAGALVLRGVTVAGGERGARVRKLDLELPVGSVTALTGASGAGKSTLAALVLGILAPSAGTITVGGVDLSNCNLDHWRAACAWVPQTPVLMPASLRENARLSAPAADDAQIRAALAQVGLSGLLASMPAGLDTALGEDGARLSTGELRRLALARAVLADAALLVLDEPTAQLDATSATTLRATLEELAGERTVVLITHDPQLATGADRIVRMQAGRIAGIEPGARKPRPAAGRPAEHSALRVLAAPAPPATSTPARPAAPAAGETRPGLFAALRLFARHTDARVRRRLLQAVALGTVSAIAAIAVLSLSGGLIVEASTQPPVMLLTAVIVLVRAFSVARATGRYGERLASHDAALRTLTSVRVLVLEHVAKHVPGRWSDRSSTAMDRAVGDVDRSADLLVRVLVPGLSTVVAAGLGLAVITALAPTVGLATAGGCVALAVVVVAFAGRAGNAQAKAEPGRALLAREVVTALDAGPELLLAGRSGEQRARVLAQSAALERSTALQAARGAALNGIVAAGAAGLAVAAAALLTGPLGDGTLSAPTAAALVLGALAIAEALEGLTDAALALGPAAAAAGRLAPALTDAAGDAATHPSTPLALDPVLTAEGIVLDRGQRRVLDGAALTLQPGERIALSGENGAGKSTLLLVLAGLLPPREGGVFVDGTDLHALDEHQRALRVTWAPSAPHLFGGTLAANLRLADVEASDERLHAALTAVGLGDWLATLPDGLETLLGDDAARASGGQRQRIGLARAWLSPAPIVLLDEPASHLPEADAIAALDAVLRARPGRSAILVTHRASERTLTEREVILAGGTLQTPDRPALLLA